MATTGSARVARSVTARRPRLAVVGWIAVAGCAAAAVSMSLTLTNDELSAPGVRAGLNDWLTLTYVFAGLTAWLRRPESRFGPLMVAVGFAAFLSSLSLGDRAVPFTLGTVFDLMAGAVFLHVCLAFPNGRLERRLERPLVVAAYVTTVGLQLVAMALGGFGPDNLLEVNADRAAAWTVGRVNLVTLSAFLVIGFFVLVARRRRASRPVRRWPAVLVDSFALGLLMLVVLYMSAAFGLEVGGISFEMIWRLTVFVIGLAPVAFLIGLLHARLAQSAVGDLVKELRRDPGPGELSAALARALRDPSLGLVYWLPKFESWADMDGRPVALADLDAGRTTTLIDREEGHVAALVHDVLLDDEPELLEAVAAAAAIALDNTRLHVELRARVDELKASRERIVTAGDVERRRLERDLHDGAQQRMVAAALQLRLAEGHIRDDPVVAERLVKTASGELALSLKELRELARGLHPAVLEHGLRPALDALATRSTVPTTVSFEPSGRLPERVELAAYFVACEALANVAKHANASSATMRVWRSGAVTSIEIADDGVGGADDSAGSGLRGLADRVEALDGTLRISSRPNAGTVVTAEMPCES